MRYYTMVESRSPVAEQLKGLDYKICRQMNFKGFCAASDNRINVQRVNKFLGGRVHQQNEVYPAEGQLIHARAWGGNARSSSITQP